MQKFTAGMRNFIALYSVVLISQSEDIRDSEAISPISLPKTQNALINLNWPSRILRTFPRTIKSGQQSIGRKEENVFKLMMICGFRDCLILDRGIFHVFIFRLVEP